MPSQPKMLSRVCQCCGDSFLAKAHEVIKLGQGKYCSNKCTARSSRHYNSWKILPVDEGYSDLYCDRVYMGDKHYVLD